MLRYREFALPKLDSKLDVSTTLRLSYTYVSGVAWKEPTSLGWAGSAKHRIHLAGPQLF